MMKLYLILSLFFQTGDSVTARHISSYPQGYFRNPLNIPISLAGNFGECRPGHFHSGMDIKTNAVENLPVYAAADGYVSRIKMDKSGFGHALYITHPNGFTTLYAHLNDFVPGLMKLLKDAQYRQQNWAVDLSLTPERFPVEQGQQIAWSGNTGGSTAPHLHFEIRDTKTEHPLNPQLFGFDINDNRPAVPTMIALYDLNRSVYEQTPGFVKLVKTAGGFTTAADTIQVNTSLLGIGVDINDYMDGSENTLAFYTADWSMDGLPAGSIELNDIGYDVSRYLHAYADYKTKQKRGAWFQCLFQLPGNRLDGLYKNLNKVKGAMELTDSEVHSVAIVFTDDANNRTTINLKLKKAGQGASLVCSNMLAVNKSNRYKDPNLEMDLDETALYDNVCLKFSKKDMDDAFSDRFTVHDPDVPLHTYSDLRIKPDRPVPFSLRDKIVLMYSDGKTEDGRAAAFDNGWYKARIRNFGEYWLAADTAAPRISPMQKENADLSKSAAITFKVKDDLTSVKTFRAELDGKWICFEPRGDNFFYRFDDHCSRGKHTLVVTAADESGNVRSLRYNFTR